MTALGIQDGQPLRPAPEITNNLQKDAMDRESAVIQGGAPGIGASGFSIIFSLLLLAGGAGRRGDLLRRRGAGGVIDRAGPSLIRTDPAGDPVQRAGSRASGGKMGKRKRPGQTARRALLLWPLVCTGGNGSGGVRPGAGGGRYTRVFCPLYPGRPGCT